MSNESLADTPTPPAMSGTWILHAPDGRFWQADSPIKCCRLEMNERVPADVALARIARGIQEARAEETEIEQLRSQLACRDNDLKSLELRRDSLQSVLSKTSDQADEQAAEISRLRSQLSARDSDLKAQQQWASGEIESLKASLREQTEKRLELHRQLSAREAEISELRSRDFCEMDQADTPVHKMENGKLCVACWNEVCRERNELRGKLTAYEACLTNLRKEMPEVEEIRDRVRRNLMTNNAHLTHVELLLQTIDNLFLHEAANRNAIAIHLASIARLTAANVEQVARIERLEGALRRIDAIIDSPATFNSDIQTVVNSALTGADGQPQGRTHEQYAIEHGRYLATAAKLFMDSCNAVWSAQQAVDDDETDTQNEADGLINSLDEAKELQSEYWRGLDNAIYEFTKRAHRAYPLAQRALDGQSEAKGE